ncbi:alkaline phosphatase family protein [Archangium violaceum]|uniref:alkaline phosphatase family protein n=1 Tax=Archangium violaceum TaxID=83451 RepID=UPI002B2E8AF3|nr:alkaline phosphatase family protein [Archangium gephyra]
MRDRIKHVVVIMLENRGFDSLLGYLYRPGDEPAKHIPELTPGGKKFDGLAFTDTQALTNELRRDGRLWISQAPVPGVRATNNPGTNPHEDYTNVNEQLFGAKANPPKGTEAKMLGFLQNYASHWSHLGENELKTISQVMHAYRSVDVPVLSGLARGYAVSDDWFSSVPTMTNANRAFSLAGTSLGRVDNKPPLADDRYDTDTVWHVLERNGYKDWAVFYHDAFPPFGSKPYTRGIFPRLEQLPNVDTHFLTMDRFFSMAEAGILPGFSYIEPKWGGDLLGIPIRGNDYHPNGDVTDGEALLKQIYLSLSRNKAAWEQTLLVITFDEHGGTYDHVAPPWTARPPWGSGKPSFELQHDFQFDRFGVRIPTLLVSPLIDERTLLRSSTEMPFDHTSVIATLLEWKGIDRSQWGLGERVANAPTFEKVLTRSTPRTDNIFSRPSPAVGTPLEFGAPFCMRHKNGEYVTNAYSGKLYYFPRLGQVGRVALDFRLGQGVVQSGAVVQLRTSEVLPDTRLVPNFLGAWSDDHDCYYYCSDDTKDYGQQYWKVTRADGSSGPIRYGDEVHISSNFEKFLGQRLCKDGQWISTASGASDTWIIEPPPAQSPGQDVVKFEDSIQLRHQTGDYVITAESAKYHWPQLGSTGQVKLQVVGGIGDVTDGSTLQLKSTEEGLGDQNILGAFGDSHDCYYWTRDYDNNKQGWKVTRADGSGDGKIRYGDKVYLTNLSYSGQKLIRDTQYAGFITTAEGQGEYWIIERVPAPPPPDVVRFGDNFYLCSQDGRYVITADRSKYKWPRLGSTGQVKLQLLNGIGELTNGQTVKMKSTEDGLGNQNILGAFGDSHDCYYWDNGYDDNKQGWKVTRVDGGGDGKIRYGDKVYLTNLSYSGQKLVRDTQYAGYLTTQADSTEYWIIMKA